MVIYIFPFLLFTMLAVLYQLRLLRLSRFFYGIAFFGLGLLGGLRWETGQDWPAYGDFFKYLDLSQNPFELYFNEQFVRPQFEIGYYLLNFIVKYLGGSYSVVFILASLFCSYAVYRFTYRLKVNKFYVLTIYVSYSFLLLHFAQVRQSIAVAFFLLGCDYYRRHRKMLMALAICLLGLFFQYSEIFYIILLIAVIAWSHVKKHKILWAVIICIGIILTMYAIYHFLDFYTLLMLLVPESALYKIKFYQERQTTQGTGLILYASYLTLLVMYLIRYSRHFTEERSFISHLAILSIALTIMLIFIFPGSYVMYSRAYVVGCILQACASSLIFATRKGFLHKIVFISTMVVAFAYYLRFLTFYGDEYLPYLSIFS
jgi:hypothetical protein